MAMRVDNTDDLGDVRHHETPRGETKQVVLNMETPPLDTGPMMRALAAGLAEVVREIRQIKPQVNVGPDTLSGLEKALSRSFSELRETITSLATAEPPVVNIPAPDMSEVKALAKQVERVIDALPKEQAAKLSSRGLSGEMRVLERGAYGDITRVGFTIKPSK